MRIRAALAGAIMALATGVLHAAEPYPARAMHMITVLPAGPDAYIRVLAARMGEQMRFPMIVDNRPDRKSTRLNSSPT